jgi:glycosyltransferase involved in cell wall biosynthesis
VIRFFAGSPSHDANFALVAPVLGVFMWAHQDVRLEIVGHVTRPQGQLPAGRVRHVPALPFEELPRLLGSSWVTLAPVASTTFNRCKSAIKFLESAAFGAPCIATSSWDMARHRDGGVMLADDETAWLEALNALSDDDVRMAIGARGRQYVDRHGDANGSCLLRGVADV